MEIKILNLDFHSEYEKFLLSNKEGLFYYSLKYRDFLKELLGCEEEYLVAVDGKNIIGILPLMYINGEYGRVYNSLPYYGSHGGIIA